MARFAISAVLAYFLFVACTEAYVKPSGAKDLQHVLDCLQKDGRFTHFLKLFKSSGFSTIIGRYATVQPVTILAPTDAAFKKLPQRVKAQLKGPKLIKMLEFHLMLQKFPAEYLRFVLNTAFFDSVLGEYIYKQAAVDKKTIILSASKRATPGQMAVVTLPDTCGLSYPTLSVQGLSTVLLPDSLFSTQTH